MAAQDLEDPVLKGSQVESFSRRIDHTALVDVDLPASDTEDRGLASRRGNPITECRAQANQQLAHDEETRVVFGMAMEAIKLGAVDDVLPIGEIAGAIRAFNARG